MRTKIFLQLLAYVTKNIEEGKRRIRIASKEFEANASNTIDQCHRNIKTLLDMLGTTRNELLGAVTEPKENGGDPSGTRG